MSLSGAGTLCQIGLRKKFELKLSNNSIFGGLKCNCQFGYILCLFLDYFNKFLCIISVPNLNGGNVPKFHVRNVPNFEVGNVPNLKLGNCIQSIIMHVAQKQSDVQLSFPCYVSCVENFSVIKVTQSNTLILMVTHLTRDCLSFQSILLIL